MSIFLAIEGTVLVLCFRKRRNQRKSPISIAVSVLDLDEDETTRKGINLSESKLWITVVSH